MFKLILSRVQAIWKANMLYIPLCLNYYGAMYKIKDDIDDLYIPLCLNYYLAQNATAIIGIFSTFHYV